MLAKSDGTPVRAMDFVRLHYLPALPALVSLLLGCDGTSIYVVVLKADHCLLLHSAISRKHAAANKQFALLASVLLCADRLNSREMSGSDDETPAQV